MTISRAAWSPLDLERLQHLWSEQGLGAAEIATALDRTEDAVRVKVAVQGYKRSPRYIHEVRSARSSGRKNPNARWTEDEENLLRNLWEENGLSASEAAPYFTGKTETAIKIKAKRLGLKHTGQQFRAVLSRKSAGELNGMWGRPGYNLGRKLPLWLRQKIGRSNREAYATGRKVRLVGSLNPMYGNHSGLGRKRSPLTCSRISRARIRHWDSMSVSQKQLKVTQLHKGLLRIGKSVRSSIEILVEAMLVNLGASFEAQSQIDFYLVDFQVGQKVIEVQGDYWHANPIKYPDPNLWDRTQKMCVKRDKAKRTLLQRRGYQILALWETDIKKHPEMCSLQLKEFLACPPTL